MSYRPDQNSMDYLSGVEDGKEEAAAELRRLHSLNTELVEALEEICSCPQWVDEATVPKAGIESAPQQVVLNMSVALMRLNKARAAIQKAKGESNE